MDHPQILHHGAAEGVTGSCHRYQASPHSHLLIDCGLFQGQCEADDALAQHRVDFDLSAVRALLVTHVHIDHIGRLPYLLAAGFEQPIYCSEPSARLLPLVIEDALKVGFTRDRALIERFLERVGGLLRPLPYAQWQLVAEDATQSTRIRLQRAGHILGSAYVEIDTHWPQQESEKERRHRTVFSGDLGAPHAPLLPAPKAPEYADTLVIESTYGNRRHENRQTRRQRLRLALEHALANRGTVMIPAFSIGRTQELLYELEDLIHENSGKEGRNKVGHQGQQDTPLNWSQLQIIVDSPLAARFTRVYRQLRPFWDAEAMELVAAGRHPLDFDQLHTVDSHEEHMRLVTALAKTRQPAVVLAASGMAAGGRIVNYLRAMLGDPAHSLLFVGYQAAGTTGRALQQLADRRRDPAAWREGERVTIEGSEYPVRVRIETIGGYSAHADREDLLDFVRGMSLRPRQIRIVHGDQPARQGLADALTDLYAGDPVDIQLPQQS